MSGGRQWSYLALEGEEITTIAVDPRNAKTMYAGLSGRGVFRSTDGGRNWSTHNRGLTDRSVQTLALDARGHALYAGTRGAGVFAFQRRS